jgi:hypothetical protein
MMSSTFTGLRDEVSLEALMLRALELLGAEPAERPEPLRFTQDHIDMGVIHGLIHRVDGKMMYLGHEVVCVQPWENDTSKLRAGEITGFWMDEAHLLKPPVR